MAEILAELLLVGEESGRTARIHFKRREEMTAGNEERKGFCCRLPTLWEQEARDDILGGTPTMAIAGLLLASSFQEEAITTSQVPSVQNWTCDKPKVRKARPPRRRCGKV
jgi:hypothetical protein